MKNINVKSIEWNSDLVGYILTLHDERIVQVQFDINTNKLKRRN